MERRCNHDSQKNVAKSMQKKEQGKGGATVKKGAKKEPEMT